MPSYDENANKGTQMAEYEKMKKQLKELLAKKRTLDRNLAAVEEEIYSREGAYLEDTPNGNVARGFDGYIKGGQNKRRSAPGEQDRIFSMSSAIFLKSQLKEDDDKV
jgi:chromatin modification-related protein EAF6